MTTKIAKVSKVVVYGACAGAMATMIVAQGGWLDVVLIGSVGLAAWLVIELWYCSPRRA